MLSKLQDREETVLVYFSRVLSKVVRNHKYEKFTPFKVHLFWQTSRKHEIKLLERSRQRFHQIDLKTILDKSIKRKSRKKEGFLNIRHSTQWTMKKHQNPTFNVFSVETPIVNVMVQNEHELIFNVSKNT